MMSLWWHNKADTGRNHVISSKPSPIGGPDEGVDVSIEYCVGCRWMLRSTWIAQELLETFASSRIEEVDRQLSSVRLVPSKGQGGGVFRVTALKQGQVNPVLLWDRKTEGRFPEAKELKQLLRDLVDPCLDLGHSDRPAEEKRE
eukprot:TRINITY_DN4627_c0_g1_i2.p1 TRINITY_DN4627_c0_g1~~TRINITY_DN4627_c0_g1_i2.p1  ORF type:complete len:144 (+),score=23.31 TRINITY_DN4627_c0_g1_i2:205-636(+)